MFEYLYHIDRTRVTDNQAFVKTQREKYEREGEWGRGGGGGLERFLS